MAKEVDPRIRHIEYRCTVCGKEFERGDLLVKIVSWKGIGRGAKTVRSRSVAWVCPDCRELDSHWTREGIVTSPGMRNTKVSPDE